MKYLTIRKVSIFLILIFWPISLFFANTFPNFLNYLFPSVLIGLSYFLYSKNNKSYLTPTLLIPFIQPKLAFLPLIFLTINTILIYKETKQVNKLLIIASLIVFLIFSRQFINQSIFTKDHEARQAVIRKTLLYPNVLTARIFQNKARIYIDKFNDNFFSLIDPSNYFFGFQPRQIVVNNQNLDKYPFLAIFLFAFGLYFLKNNNQRKFLATLILGSILSLSLLVNFDRHDFILWVPLSVIIIHGLKEVEIKLGTKARYFYLIFIAFSTAQLLRLFIQYL